MTGMSADAAKWVTAEREFIIAHVNRMISNALLLGDRDKAIAYEAVRNYVIRRQDDGRWTRA